MGALRGFVARVREWVRAGYPTGVPATGYEPLLALLGRRLTRKEVKQVTRDLIDRARAAGKGKRPIARTEAEAAITDRTNTPAAEKDIKRVRKRLKGKGWPFAE